MNILFLSSSMLILKKQQHFIPVFQCFHGTSCISKNLQTTFLFGRFTVYTSLLFWNLSTGTKLSREPVRLTKVVADRESRLGVHAALQILLQTGRKEKHSIIFLETNTFIIKIKKKTQIYPRQSGLLTVAVCSRWLTRASSALRKEKRAELTFQYANKSSSWTSCKDGNTENNEWSAELTASKTLFTVKS